MQDFNNAQELKEFIITEVLTDLAEKAGKPLSEMRRAFEAVDFIREVVMEKVEKTVFKIAYKQGLIQSQRKPK